MTNTTTISEELRRFVKEYVSDHYALQLILFFADHPQARFSELAIIHALNQNGGRRFLQKALRALVDKGMLKMYMNSSIPLYSLLDDMRSMVLELARLDMQQRQLLTRQTYSATVIKGGHLLKKMVAEVLPQISEAAVTIRQNPAISSKEKSLLNENMPLVCSLNQEPVTNAAANL